MNADFVKVNLDYSIHRVIAFIVSNEVIRFSNGPPFTRKVDLRISAFSTLELGTSDSHYLIGGLN